MPSVSSALQINDNMARCKQQSSQDEDVPSDCFHEGNSFSGDGGCNNVLLD
jgi:hypothetical protein